MVDADLAYPFYTSIQELHGGHWSHWSRSRASPDVKQVELGVDAQGQPIYLNEDSIAFEFDETNLFRANKFPGYDLYEDGLRANVGARGTIMWDDGRRASLLVGRSLRTETNDAFTEQSGLRRKASDWIVAGQRRAPAGRLARSAAPAWTPTTSPSPAPRPGPTSPPSGAAATSATCATAPTPTTGRRSRTSIVGGEVYLTKNWGVMAYGNRDLDQDAWVIRDLGVVYRDECTRIDFIYRREDTLRGRLGPSESFTIRLTLATLGEPIYAQLTTAAARRPPAGYAKEDLTHEPRA